MTGARSDIPQTWRALAAPRRAVPIGAVGATLVVTEWLASRSVAAVLVDVALVAAFVLAAPAAWRRLFGAGTRAPSAAIGVALYAGLALGVVGALGVALPRALGLAGTYVADPASLGVLVALFGVGGWGLGRDVELELGVEAAQRRAEALALDAERAQILALRAQLDPHFLYNTLNAIAEWCRDDPAVAERATLELAKLLRTIQGAIGHPTWPLGEELALLRQLVALYEIRDRERYRFVLDVPDPAPDVHVPPMLLLPLFENAITHGPSAGHRGEVRVRVVASAGGVAVEIRNPGAFAGRRDGGHGIATVERRLALAYGDRARAVVRADGDATLAEVTLPLEVAHEEALAT